MSFVSLLKQVDFCAFSHGAPSSSHSQVCVCLFGKTWQDSVYDKVRQCPDAFPWDPLLTGGVCLGLTWIPIMSQVFVCQTPTTVSPEGPSASGGVQSICQVSLSPPVRDSPLRPRGTQGPYVRCPSILLSAPFSFCIPRDPHVQQVGCKFPIE